MPIASLLAAALVASASTVVLAQAPTANLQSCVPAGAYNAAYDYFPNKAQNLSSSGFTVAYYPNYKVVTNIIANTTTVLYQCGTPAPANGSIPAGAKVVAVPVVNATLSDVTSLTFIELLGKRTTLSYIDGVDFIVSPCIQQLNATGAVDELESANQTLQDAQFLSTSVVFGSPFGAAPEPNFISFSATSAPSPLLRSSWINFISLFYNAESDAATVLNSINASYTCVSGAAKNASTAVATPPTLAWAQYNAPSQYNNNTASWQFNNASYKLAYTRDAGLTPLNSAAKFTSAADFQVRFPFPLPSLHDPLTCSQPPPPLHPPPTRPPSPLSITSSTKPSWALLPGPHSSPNTTSPPTRPSNSSRTSKSTAQISSRTPGSGPRGSRPPYPSRMSC
ncbi:hypothetical protein M427DRAFT_443851 [Gonapodya prolifera JEL478]|uniref:Uncharacterized protein n=1 Tax=Gonapodya prolifera (strain JEL478) TaxID=1344416 RepID=A0A139A491_GONPJ|nr:hypothetical protein M427DRAFT_443851 [Gonapodya prolifera JEL478]|eukprot:KXS11173.1 hypothetical protein M427DRAFT_443851 [Gonapodya prolifera JEL478]